MSTGMIIDGIASTPDIDSSGEILDLKGANIDDLIEGKGLFCYEHKGHDGDSNGEEIVGRILTAKKIYKESDCETERHRLFFEKARGPFLYIIGRLYDGAGHEGAKAIAAQIRDHAANDEPIIVSYSVEGSTLKKEGNVLKETMIRRVAVTTKPCLKTTELGIVADPNAPEGFPTASEAVDVAGTVTRKTEVDPRYQRLGGSAIEYSPDMVKALAAGIGSAAPGTLTGGAALQREDVDSKVKALAMSAFRDWDRVPPFRKFLKSRLPEVSDEFLDHFSDIVDKHLYRVKKAAEHIADLRKAGKLKSPQEAGVAAKGPKEQEPLTIRGEPVKAGRVKSPVFDEKKGVLRTPRGDFPMYIPSKAGDGESFKKLMDDPKINQFHDYVMGNWSRAHKLMKAGQLPPEVVMHGVLFSQMSPNTPVASQELMYSHLVDSMRETGIDPRQAEGLDVLRRDWLNRDSPAKFPAHSPEHWRRLEDSLRIGSDSKLTGRKAGDIGSFMLANNKFKNIAQYNSLHEGLMDVLGRHRADGRSIVSELMAHKHASGLHDGIRDRALASGRPDPGPYTAGPSVPGLAPKTARYTMGMIGAGNVAVPDTHFARYLFGLDKSKDTNSLDYLKNTLWNTNNTHVLDAIDRYYARHHDAVEHMVNHPKWGSTFENREDAIFPAFWKNWMAIVPHEKARGIPSYGYNELTDHKPFWQAIEPHLAKSEDDQSLPLQTAGQHAQWVQQYGPMAAQALYFRYLLPKLLDAGASRQARELVMKFEELSVDLRALAKGGPESIPTSTPESVQYQGKQVRPGTGFLVEDNMRGPPLGIVHASPSEFTAVPHEKLGAWAPEDLVRIPRGDSRRRLEVLTYPESREEVNRVDASQHGVPEYLRHDDVKPMVHGFDFGQPHFPATDGSRSRFNWWGKDAEGKPVYVKSSPGEDVFGEIRAEGLYHNLARDFFGLGHYLPRVANIYHPQTGQEHAVIEGVDGEHHNHRDPAHIKALEDMGASGELHRLAFMNSILGNVDRHRRNWLWTRGPNPAMKLIDHGLAFYGVPDRQDPHYIEQHNVAAPVHPAASAWVRGLDPVELDQQMRRHGAPESVIQTSVDRLKATQDHLKLRPNSSIHDAWYLPQVHAAMGGHGVRVLHTDDRDPDSGSEEGKTA